jgi:hypothetical protein
MTQVKFIKWYPFTREIPHVPDSRFAEIKWDEIKTHENDDEWLNVVSWLITFGFYVGIHWDSDENIITIAVDTTWFKQR